MLFFYAMFCNMLTKEVYLVRIWNILSLIHGLPKNYMPPRRIFWWKFTDHATSASLHDMLSVKYNVMYYKTTFLISLSNMKILKIGKDCNLWQQQYDLTWPCSNLIVLTHAMHLASMKWHTSIVCKKYSFILLRAFVDLRKQTKSA